MPLLSLLRRNSDHVGRHSAGEHCAPAEAPCIDCDKTEPDVTLAECSVCKAWRCTACYTMHSAPAGWDDRKPSLWLRLLRKVARRG